MRYSKRYMSKNEIIGVSICLLSVVLGLYLGIWVCFIGGIVQAIEAVRAVPVSAFNLAMGIARVMSASVVGWLSGIVGISIGKAFLD